jgi:hypothetical protein
MYPTITCPRATVNPSVNEANRYETANEHQYGPLVDPRRVQACASCGAFDRSPAMQRCMVLAPDAWDLIAIRDGGTRGYCWGHAFIATSNRWCNTWHPGGPITIDAASPLLKKA